MERHKRIPCFDSCQLIMTLMCNQFSSRATKWLESVRVPIGMPVVRTDGRVGGWTVYDHEITNFSRKGSLPHFLTHGALTARFSRQSSANNNNNNNSNLGTGVGQVGASAYHWKLDAPTHQSLGWHFWQVPVTPCHPRWGNNIGRGTLQSWSAALLEKVSR